MTQVRFSSVLRCLAVACSLVGFSIALPSNASAAPIFNFGFSGGVPVSLNVITNVGFVVLSTSTSQFTPGIQNQGWWSATDSNDDFNDNYFVGTLDPDLLNNFFSFDTSRLAGLTVLGADLSLDAYTIDSPGTGNTYILYDVSTDAATLNFNSGTSAAIFNDLGSGTSYGTFFVPVSASNTLISLTLNAAGLADLQLAADQGAFFSVGGTLDLQAPPSTIPEPASMAIFGLGALGMAVAARARRKS